MIKNMNERNVNDIKEINLDKIQKKIVNLIIYSYIFFPIIIAGLSFLNANLIKIIEIPVYIYGIISFLILKIAIPTIIIFITRCPYCNKLYFPTI